MAFSAVGVAAEDWGCVGVAASVLSLLAGVGGGGSCDWAVGVEGLEAVRGEGDGIADCVLGVAEVVVVVELLEGVVGGSADDEAGAGEEGAGLGEAPRSERPNALEAALPSEAAGELGVELGGSPSEAPRPWLADDFVRPEPNTLRRCDAIAAHACMHGERKKKKGTRATRAQEGAKTKERGGGRSREAGGGRKMTRPIRARRRQ